MKFFYSFGYCTLKMEKILVTNRGELAGYVILKDLGIVSASISPSRFFTKDIIAGIRQWFGKEMKEYTQMIEKARETVLERMKKIAEEKGANAIVNVRFMGSSISAMSAEMMGYGTAVKVKPK